MADTPILLREQQYHQIKAVLARLRMDASAKVVFLVDKDGQEIASQGEVGNLDTTSLASLAAGNVAAYRLRVRIKVFDHLAQLLYIFLCKRRHA